MRSVSNGGAVILYSADLAFEVSRNNLNRLIMRDLVPVGETTRKEVSTMAKITIAKWWIWGSIAIALGGILAGVMSEAAAIHAANITAGSRSFVPDSLFWTTISFLVLGCIVCCGGVIGQFVAWIGGVVNTHRLADKTWFRVVLWGWLVGYLVLFVTLGFQLWFSFSGSVAAAFVWPGFAVGGLIGPTVMLCFLVTGPDGTAIQQPQRATLTTPPKTLVPTG
jgi:hypothetical protein